MVSSVLCDLSSVCFITLLFDLLGIIGRLGVVMSLPILSTLVISSDKYFSNIDLRVFNDGTALQYFLCRIALGGMGLNCGPLFRPYIDWPSRYDPLKSLIENFSRIPYYISKYSSFKMEWDRENHKTVNNIIPRPLRISFESLDVNPGHLERQNAYVNARFGISARRHVLTHATASTSGLIRHQ